MSYLQKLCLIVGYLAKFTPIHKQECFCAAAMTESSNNADVPKHSNLESIHRYSFLPEELIKMLILKTLLPGGIY